MRPSAVGLWKVIGKAVAGRPDGQTTNVHCIQITVRDIKSTFIKTIIGRVVALLALRQALMPSIENDEEIIMLGVLIVKETLGSMACLRNHGYRIFMKSIECNLYDSGERCLELAREVNLKVLRLLHDLLHQTRASKYSKVLVALPS